MPIPYQIFFRCNRTGVGTTTLPINAKFLKDALQGYELDPDFFIAEFIHWETIDGGNTVDFIIYHWCFNRYVPIVKQTADANGVVQIKCIVDDSMPFPNYQSGIALDTRQPVSSNYLSIVVDVTVGAAASEFKGLISGTLWLKGDT